ncbi:translation initiation factor IF-2-like [Thrips palmi]|uniref:Translation initiation factor IF-2-like n=1 Tax=Thrips palmi TaxID=161013 RepID=A0A6P8YZZ8_THRPL|nr:translation initiation factor IF-2-like [Thrips palmi]
MWHGGVVDMCVRAGDALYHLSAGRDGGYLGPEDLHNIVPLGAERVPFVVDANNIVHGLLRGGGISQDLQQGLEAFFEVFEAGILTTSGYSIAVHRQTGGQWFNIVDSHCRNRRTGLLDADGVAVLVQMRNLRDMVQHVLALFSGNQQYSIMPVLLPTEVSIADQIPSEAVDGPFPSPPALLPNLPSPPAIPEGLADLLGGDDTEMADTNEVLLPDVPSPPAIPQGLLDLLDIEDSDATHVTEGSDPECVETGTLSPHSPTLSRPIVEEEVEETASVRSSSGSSVIFVASWQERDDVLVGPSARPPSPGRPVVVPERSPSPAPPLAPPLPLDAMLDSQAEVDACVSGHGRGGRVGRGQPRGERRGRGRPRLHRGDTPRRPRRPVGRPRGSRGRGGSRAIGRGVPQRRLFRESESDSSNPDNPPPRRRQRRESIVIEDSDDSDDRALRTPSPRPRPSPSPPREPSPRPALSSPQQPLSRPPTPPAPDAELQARRALIREQDAAYEASARADRQREERQQEEAAAQVALEAAREGHRQEVEVLRREVASRLRPEPPRDTSMALTLRFFLPDGRRLQRRFMPSDDLRAVHDFLFVEGVNHAQLLLANQQLPVSTGSDPVDVATALSGVSATIMVRLVELEEDDICTICYESFLNYILRVQTDSCGHFYHRECLQRWIDSRRLGPQCPYCRRNFRNMVERPINDD